MTSSSLFAQDFPNLSSVSPTSKVSTKEDQLVVCLPLWRRRNQRFYTLMSLSIPSKSGQLAALHRKAPVRFPPPPDHLLEAQRQSHCPRAPWEVGVNHQGWQWLVRALEGTGWWRDWAQSLAQTHLCCFSAGWPRPLWVTGRLPSHGSQMWRGFKEIRSKKLQDHRRPWPAHHSVSHCRGGGLLEKLDG